MGIKYEIETRGGIVSPETYRVNRVGPRGGRYYIGEWTDRSIAESILRTFNASTPWER